MSSVWTEELRSGKGRVEKVKRLPPATRVADLLRAAGRVPEAVVQISASKSTGKDGKVVHPSPQNLSSLEGLIAYVSRVSDKDKDDLEMTDEMGLTYSGRAELKDAIRGWQMPIKGDRREVIHVVMSMPRDTRHGSLTDVAAVERAAQSTAEKLFDGHSFLIVHHRDGEKGNPHAHVLVRMAPKLGGKRLNPRKPDLQRYRETYAHELREQGVEANATTARQRFSQVRNVSQASEQMYKKRNRAKNELAARMGVTPAPDEQPNRVKKAPEKPDMDQYRAHMVAVKKLQEAGRGRDAKAVVQWLNAVAPREAVQYGHAPVQKQAPIDEQVPTQKM